MRLRRESSGSRQKNVGEEDGADSMGVKKKGKGSCPPFLPPGLNSREDDKGDRQWWENRKKSPTRAPSRALEFRFSGVFEDAAQKRVRKRPTGNC